MNCGIWNERSGVSVGTVGCGCRRVVDVFMSKKKITEGRKFGFVRHVRVILMEVMEEKLNHIWFGSLISHITCTYYSIILYECLSPNINSRG